MKEVNIKPAHPQKEKKNFGGCFDILDKEF